MRKRSVSRHSRFASFPACVIPNLIGNPEDGNHPFFNVLLGELRREGEALYPLFHRATIEDSLGRQRDSPGSRVKANLGKNRIELFPGEPWFSHRVSWKPGAKPLRPCVIGFPKRERRQILPAHAHGILGKLKNMSFRSRWCLCLHRSVHSSETPSLGLSPGWALLSLWGNGKEGAAESLSKRSDANCNTFPNECPVQR